MMDEQMRWQAVMLIAPKRVECECGALALFVVLDDPGKRDDKTDYDYTGWCQECWRRAQDNP